VANSADGTVTRIDPGSRRVDGEPIEVVKEQLLALTVGEGGVWAAGSDSPVGDGLVVRRIDPASKEVDEDPIPVSGGNPLRLAAGLGSVWVTDAGNPVATDARPTGVNRIDPATLTVSQSIPVGFGPAGIAVGEDVVLVANSADGTVTPIRP